MEVLARLEIENPISGEARNSFKNGDTSHSNVLHKCLHASQNLVLKNQFTYTTILVGCLEHALDEVKQIGHPKIRMRYGLSGF
jgi:hypothetical protein